MRIQILFLGFKGLRGNARGTSKWPLNGGWPLNRGSSEISKTFRRLATILKQTRDGSSIATPIRPTEKDGGCTFYHNSFRTCNSNIAYPRFEVYKTFLCVVMSNFMVFMR